MLDKQMHATMLSGAKNSKMITGDLGAIGRQFATLAADTGKWQTVQKRVNDQTVQLTENLLKQKATYKDIAAARKSGLLELARQEQLRLRTAQVSTLGRTPAGQHYAQMMIPSQVTDGMDTMNRRLGFQSALLKSASTQMVNFGKNTQWAGRQLTVGFTMPLIAAGAAVGYYAYQADKSLTRIAKVYDTTVNQNLSLADQAMDREKQLAQLRVDGMNTARVAAQQYGASMKDTLETQGDLAATGQKGRELQVATNQTMRLATLGEMDYQTAVQASISLQSVFGQSAEDLTKSFNYMNAVENQTSLSMQDFATAIPIAAAPIKALGGNVEDLGTLLVAMKARGIDAAEGANAIKSSFTRLLNPSKQVQMQFKEMTGVDIVKLIDSTKGELIPTFKALGDSVKNLDKLGKARVLGKLFGTYQNTRINAMMTGITEDMDDASTQVGRAVELAHKTDEQLAGVADSELQRMQNSASGRLKIAVESIKVDLAAMGQGFLESAIDILSGAENIIEAFRNLPGPLKGFLKWMVIIVGAIGPLAMLTGLFFNMVGTVGKAAGSLGMFLTKFKLLNRDSVLAEKAASAATTAMDRQTKSVDSLAQAIAGLNEQLLQAARANGALTASTNTAVARKGIAERVSALKDQGAQTNQTTGNTTMMMAGGQSGARRRRKLQGEDARIMRNAQQKWTRNGAVPLANVQTIDEAHAEANRINASKNAIIQTREANAQARATAMAAAEEKKRQQAMNASKLGAGLLTASIVASLVPIGEGSEGTKAIKDHLLQAAMAAGLLLPVIGNVSRAVGAAKIASGSLSAAFMGSGLVTRTRLFSSNLSLAAKGAGATGKRFKDMAGVLGAGKGLFNPWVLGLTAAAAGAYMLYKHLSNAKKQAEKLNQDASGLAKIFDFTELPEGTKVDPKTGTAIKTLTQQVKELKAEYPGLGAAIKNAGSAQDQFNAAAFQGMKAFNAGASVEQARAVVKAALTAAYDDADKAEKILLKFKFDPNNLAQQVEIANAKVKDGMEKSGKGSWNPWKDVGDSDFAAAAKSFRTAITSAMESGNAGGAAKSADAFIKGFNDRLMKAKTGDRFDMAQTFLSAFGEQMGASDKKIDSVLDGVVKRAQADRKNGSKITIDDLMELDPSKMIKEFESINNAVDDWQKQLVSGKNLLSGFKNPKFSMENQKEAINALLQGKKLTDDQKTVLQTIATNAKIRLLTEEEIDSVLGSQKDKMAAQTPVQKSINVERNRLLSGLKAGLAGLDKQNETESKALDRRQQAQMDGMEAAQRRREAAFDRQQTAMENRHEKAQRNFDKKWDARIKKEKDAEALRQRMFEAERNRIQRLAELQNANINFNAALQKGDLDEAARVQNSQRATTQSNNLDDLDARLGAASDKRTDKLETQRESAAYKLKRHQDFEKQAFEATKKRYQDQAAAAKAAAQAGFQAEKDNLQKSQALRKANLEKAIKEVTEYDGKTQKDWDKFLKNLKGKFGNFSGAAGKSLDDAIRRSFDKINKRADSFGSSKRWGPRSADAMEHWLAGAGKKVGLSAKELKKFSENHWATRGLGGNRGGTTINHGGGALNKVSNNRKGYAANASKYPSEVNVLAKKSEYMIQTSAHRKYGTDLMDAVNAGKATIIRHSGGAIELPDGTNAGGEIRMDGMTRVWADQIAAIAKKRKEAEGIAGKLGGSMKGVDPKGWNRPWKGHYSTSNGHDYPLVYKTIYAPHSGKVRTHAIPGYEPRVGHGGHGFRSYGQWIDFDGGGTNLMFAHLSKLPRKAGSSMNVRAGQAIGVTGETGNAHGPHVHVERNHSGDNGQFGAFFRGRGVSLRKGGTLKYDQNINAHEGETVLTKKLTERFKEGIMGLANNNNTEYNINVDATGASRSDADFIAQKVMERIRFEKSRKGNNR